MGRFMLGVACLLLALSFCALQRANAAPQADSTPAASSLSQSDQGNSQDAAIRGAFPAVLIKSLDSKKLKAGDTVVCQTTAVLHGGNGMTIPNGSKVIGHVTQATARSKGDPESSLAIVFDKIQTPNGDIPLKGVLQAVAPSLGGNSGPDTGAAAPGTIPNGRGADMSTMPPPTPGAVAGPNSGVHPLNGGGSHPILTAQSTGVLGIHNLQMDKDSVLTTSGKEVKLDSGMQMMIRAEIQPPVE
ncbi:MAG: hypothetical protein WCC87_22575 [Candidatus Korobacteraceae bacterium]